MAKKLSMSPKGTLVYPWLTGKADTKFNAAGQWKTGLRVLATDAKAVALIEEIDRRMVNAVAEAKKNAKTPKEVKRVKMCDDKPYKMETDDDDAETGYVIFNFKMKASGKNTKTGEEYTRNVALFDAKGEPMARTIKVGTGSTAKVSFEFYEFAPTGKVGAGVSLRLEGVQIIKLIEWGSGSAEYFGFEDEAEDEEDSVEADGEKEDFVKALDAEDDDEDEEDEEEEEEDDKAVAVAAAKSAAKLAQKPAKTKKAPKDDF